MQNDERISVILPVWNESEEIAEKIAFLKGNGSGLIKEILVSDAGSTDSTADIAMKAGAKVIHSPKKGRAAQMNAGAAEARGEILYFLHADTVPPMRFCEQILSEVGKGAVAGCFRLRFDDPHPALTFFGTCTRFRSTLIRFGDQSLFVKRNLFQEIGGFREDLIVMEDQEIVRRIKKRGRFSVIADEVITSARKYRENGYLRLQLLFSIIWAGYYFGIPQEKLVSFYRKRIR